MAITPKRSSMRDKSRSRRRSPIAPSTSPSLIPWSPPRSQSSNERASPTALRSVNVPTLVLHGAADPLVAVSGGRATADAVPDGELVVFDGMGHDLPRALWTEITARIGDLVQRAEASARARG
jgi:pimeloyl-ACP methyl ester carboxylesterase